MNLFNIDFEIIYNTLLEKEIFVVSGKGDTGKSTIAGTLSYFLERSCGN